MHDTPVFAALAHPVRRSLLVYLAKGSPKTATQLAQDYPVTRQDIRKHLQILREARLVAVNQSGREKRYSLTPAPLSEVDQWIKEVSHTWDERLLRLKAFIIEEGSEE